MFSSFVFFWSGHTEFECNKTRVALESCTAGNKNCTAVFVSCSAVFCCKPPSEHDFLYICVKYIPQTRGAAKNCTAGKNAVQFLFPAVQYLRAAVVLLHLSSSCATDFVQSQLALRVGTGSAAFPEPPYSKTPVCGALKNVHHATFKLQEASPIRDIV